MTRTHAGNIRQQHTAALGNSANAKGLGLQQFLGETSLRMFAPVHGCDIPHAKSMGVTACLPKVWV
jgi:hypothetical protein